MSDEMRETPEYHQGRLDGLISVSHALNSALEIDLTEVTGREALASMLVGVNLSISLIEAGIA